MTIDTTDNLKPGASRDLSPKRPPTPTPLEPSRPDKKARRTPITIPADIIAHIAGYADNPTRARLLRLSRTTYDVVGSILYEHISITRQNCMKILKGFPEIPSTRRAPPVADSLQSPTSSSTDKPFALFWPHVDIDSDDEEEPEEQDRQQHRYVATKTTYERKRRLFIQVKHLTISSIPCQRTSSYLRSLAFFLADRHPGDSHRKILFPKVSVMTIEAEAVFQLLDWFDRHRESSLFFGTSRNRFVEALEKVCKPLHCCVTFPRFTSRHFRIFEAHRMAFKDRYTVPSSGEYAQDKVRNAFEKMFSRSADIVNTIRPRGLKSLTLHNYRKGELNSREVTSLRLFCTTCECEEAGKRNPKECFQHANIKSHLSAFKELARGIIDMREGRFKMLWRRKDLAERWELISPPEDEEENLQSGSWSELKEKILMKYPAWEKENSVMVDYQYAAPCICCGTKDGMFGSAEDP